MVCIKNHKESMKQLLELMGTFSKIIMDKINIWKSIVSNILAIKKWRIYLNMEMMNFKYIMLSGGIQIQKAIHYKIPFIWHCRKDKNHKNEVNSFHVQGIGRKNYSQRDMRKLFWVIKIFYIFILEAVTQVLCVYWNSETCTLKREFNWI